MSSIVAPAVSSKTHDAVKDMAQEPAKSQSFPVTRTVQESPSVAIEQRANIFVAGSLAVDIACNYKFQPDGQVTSGTLKPALHTSNPAYITQSLGGVGSNVARAAHLTGANVRYVYKCL